MKTREMERRGRARIPGGTQLLSKRPEMFAPEVWPAYYSRAKGAETWDLDGRRYIDMSITGVGACALGFADPDVDSAVKSAIELGSMSTLNCAEDVELADLMCELHPWAEMVRFARAGGEALVVAIRIARARTGRDKVAFCGYHGWHDWYLAANLAQGDTLAGHLLPGLDPAGVTRGLSGTSLPFRYNNPDDLKALCEAHGSELAAIVMEPVRSQPPSPGFLENVRAAADSTGAVMIFDEVTSAFRMNCGGIHLRFGVTPDVAVFAKAMSNGYPMAAIIGRGDVMDAAQTSFISSTAWTERVGPTAALATIRKHRDLRVAEHLVKVGNSVQRMWQEAADAHGIKINISGIPPLSHIGFGYENSQAVATLFTQSMLDRGILAGKAFYACYAHGPEHLEAYEAALGEVFPLIAEAVEKGDVENRLRGPVAHSGFYRLV